MLVGAVIILPCVNTGIFPLGYIGNILDMRLFDKHNQLYPRFCGSDTLSPKTPVLLDEVAVDLLQVFFCVYANGLVIQPRPVTDIQLGANDLDVVSFEMTQYMVFLARLFAGVLLYNHRLSKGYFAAIIDFGEATSGALSCGLIGNRLVLGHGKIALADFVNAGVAGDV